MVLGKVFYVDSCSVRAHHARTAARRTRRAPAAHRLDSNRRLLPGNTSVRPSACLQSCTVFCTNSADPLAVPGQVAPPSRLSALDAMSAVILSKLPPSVLERLVPLLPYLRYIPTRIPRSVKWLFLAVFLLNVDGLPGVWHLQIMWPFIRFRIQRALGKKWPNWRVGRDMFEFTTTRQFRATPNSSDSFGFHLSNSSYASTLDHVRGPFAIQLVGDAYGIPGASPRAHLLLLRTQKPDSCAWLSATGMTFALGGTTFDFKKEVPLGAKYEIENRLLGYDRKWVRPLPLERRVSRRSRIR